MNHTPQQEFQYTLLLDSASVMGRQMLSKLTHILIVMTYLVLLVPAYRVFPLDVHIPELAYRILYSRYLFSVILLLLISAMLIRISYSDMRQTNGTAANAGSFE